MNHDATAPPRPNRILAFTVATALAWLGHDCDGGCPGLAMCTPASLYFIPQTNTGPPGEQDILVVVDLSNDLPREARVRALLSEVDRCTRRNHVHVRERRPTDHGRDLITQPEVLLVAGAPLYLRPVNPPVARGLGRSERTEQTPATRRASCADGLQAR